MIDIVSVKKTLVVGVPQVKAFTVFTKHMSRWWPATHTILKSPLKDSIVEPRVGGRWYSVGEDGSTCDTGYVIEWRPPHVVVLAWQLNADWQFDPTLVTEVEVKFTAEGPDSTRVELEHRYLERMGEKAAQARASIDSPQGWNSILEAFKQCAEN